MMDDVSSVAAEWARSVVEGEDVEMGRCWDGGMGPEAGGAVIVCFAVVPDLGGVLESARFAVLLLATPAGAVVSGLCCVWMRVFTTSSGHVMTPAMPPAVAPVKISSGRPMSLDPTQALAIFRSCS